MKKCKSCLVEIDDNAKKCPHCHEYQNSKVISWWVLIIFGVVFFTFMVGLFAVMDYIGRPAEYINNRNGIRMEFISEHKETDFLVRNYKVYNNTKFKWTDIKFTIIGTDGGGTLIETKSDGNADWTVQPLSWSYLTVPIFVNEKVVKWDVEISDMTNKTNKNQR